MMWTKNHVYIWWTIIIIDKKHIYLEYLIITSVETIFKALVETSNQYHQNKPSTVSFSKIFFWVSTPHISYNIIMSTNF